MFCLEISINGKRMYTAGHEHMEKMRASLYLVKSGTRLFVVDGELAQVGSLTENVLWPSVEPKINDEITIRLVECEMPDKPTSVKSYGTKTSPTGGKVLYCSFCGKSQEEVKKLVAGPHANVCSECMKLLVEMFD